MLRASAGPQPPSSQNAQEPHVSQVSLVHASDSVRTVAASPATIGGPPVFAPAQTRMTKPPLRVAAPPPPPQTFLPKTHHGPLPTLSVPPMAGRPYHEIADYADLQRKHIEANRIEEERRAVIGRHNRVEAAARLQMMRRQVADEEGELRRLNELDRETKLFKMRNQDKEAECQILSTTLKDQQTELRKAASRVDVLKEQLQQIHHRRKLAQAAAIAEQVKMQQQQQLNRSHERATSNSSERPRASVEPFQVVVPQRTEDPQKVLAAETEIMDGRKKLSPTPSPPAEPAMLAPGVIQTQVTPAPPVVVVKSKPTTREDASPSPPKDPHPTESRRPLPVSPPTVPQTSKLSPLSSPEQTVLDSKVEVAVVERPTSMADSMDESKLRQSKTDLVSLRSDSLKATKRRSWAASEGTSFSELETIRRILDEQRKGRTHFIPLIPENNEENAETSEKEVVAAPVEPVTEEETSVVEEGLEMEVTRRATKGILRPPGLKKERRRIEFDPLALMLDAALEGELDLVKTSASKLSDVSAANDEGITALHNAICAGHYEIVKFLIEADADVNAQDSDGWTPLHCAASCNNLPMVRQLVEGGACVLSSTLSDMETPVEKCEEEEEGYDGCLRYLSSAHNATGTLNGAKVYAAYDYEAAYEDELSFSAGEEIIVKAKDDKEKNWWKCELLSTKEVGLVPRTYLALYPALKYRKKLNFIMFDLPLETNNNTDKKN